MTSLFTSIEARFAAAPAVACGVVVFEGAVIGMKPAAPQHAINPRDAEGLAL